MTSEATNARVVYDFTRGYHGVAAAFARQKHLTDRWR